MTIVTCEMLMNTFYFLDVILFMYFEWLAAIWLFSFAFEIANYRMFLGISVNVCSIDWFGL